MSDMVRMSIDVPANLHKFIKMKAASCQQTIREYVIGQIARDAKKAIAAAHKPSRKGGVRRKLNRLTRETIEKSMRGEDVTHYKSFDDFLREMDER